MQLACPNCQTVLEIGAERCPTCQTEIRVGTQPVGSLGVAGTRTSMAPRVAIPAGQHRVCPHCGAVTLDQRTHCGHCEESYGDSLVLLPTLFDRYFWVGIEAAIRCQACGHASPCNHLDLEHAVTCLHCGLEQRIDPNQWFGALAHAHAVADLCGPHPEGRFPNEFTSIRRQNPFTDVGVTRTSARHHGSTQDASQPVLDVVATPGHPPCLRCRAPLALARVEPPELELFCSNPACSERTTTVLPDGVRVQVPDLIGIVGREHEKGRRDVRVERGPEGLGCYCPSCAAQVQVLSYSTLVECRHCRAVSRVPDKALRMLGFERPKTELWWLLFEGPSKLRAKLERTERKAQARAPAKLGVALLPEASLGDELMRPLARGPSGIVKVAIAVFFLLALVGAVLAVLNWV